MDLTLHGIVSIIEGSSGVGTKLGGVDLLILSRVQISLSTSSSQFPPLLGIITMSTMTYLKAARKCPASGLSLCAPFARMMLEQILYAILIEPIGEEKSELGSMF